MAGKRSPWVRAAAMAATLALASMPALAKSCTEEIGEKEITAGKHTEFTCGKVAVDFASIVSEIYYHRWTGKVVVRALDKDAQAKIALAAFDAAGNLVGVWTHFARGVSRRPKTISLLMEGMFISVTDTKKILFSLSVPATEGK